MKTRYGKTLRSLLVFLLAFAATIDPISSTSQEPSQVQGKNLQGTHLEEMERVIRSGQFQKIGSVLIADQGKLVSALWVLTICRRREKLLTDYILPAIVP